MGQVAHDAQVFGLLPRGGTSDLSDVGFDFWVSSGHGPVHLLLISAAELGFALDGKEKGWLGSGISGPIQHFTLLCWMPGDKVSLQHYLRGRFFSAAEHVDVKGSLQLLTSSHLRERGKVL